MRPEIARALEDATLFPFWLDDARAETIEAPLIGPAEADLVVVGGGFTGLWAAIQAKERRPEREVILIEAGQIAHGASGRAGGIVSTSVMHGLAHAAKIFPNDLEKLEALGHANMKDFRATLERHAIDCDAEWNGEMIVAIGGAAVGGLRQEAALREKHGHDVAFLDEASTRAELASPLFSAALWSKANCGALHPAKLAWGLKRAAMRLGVKVYELTPLEAVEDRGASLALRTRSGAIAAPSVLFATNAFASGHKRIKRYVAAIRDRILVSESLNPTQRAAIGWAHRQGVYDTRTQLNYMRLTPDDRILFGGRLGYFYGGDTDPAADRASTKNFAPLAEAFFQTFPQLGGLRFSHAWSGPIALTTRMAVHFQRYFGGKGVYAGGYSGFGVGASRFGARIGLAILDREPAPELSLEFARSLPKPIPPEPFRYIGAAITMRALDEADAKGGWRKAWLGLVTRMGFPLS